MDDDKTKKYNIRTPDTEKRINSKSNKNKTKKSKKNTEGKMKKKRSKFKTFLKVFIIICILLFLVAAGVFAAIFFSDKWNMTEEDLIIKMQNHLYGTGIRYPM